MKQKKFILIFTIILVGCLLFLMSPLSEPLHEKERDKIKMLESNLGEKITIIENSEIIEERKRDEEILKSLHPEETSIEESSIEESSYETVIEESMEESLYEDYSIIDSYEETSIEESSYETVIEESMEESSIDENITKLSAINDNYDYTQKDIIYAGYEWNSEIYYLANIIENEAGGLYEDDEFLYKVGSVAINRKLSGKHGSSFYDVATETGVYQGLMDYIPYPSERISGNEWELKSFLHSYEIAEELLLNKGSILPSECLCQSGYILGDIYDTYYSEVMDSTCYFCRENFSSMELYYYYYPEGLET